VFGTLRFLKRVFSEHLIFFSRSFFYREKYRRSMLEACFLSISIYPVISIWLTDWDVKQAAILVEIV